MVELIALGELGEVVSGSTPSTTKSDYWNGDIPWITPADLTGHEGAYFHGTLRKITAAGFKSCSTRMLPKNSIIFSSRAPIGHCAVTAFPLCTNQGFKSLIPGAHLHPFYGYFALRFFTPALIAQGRGATFAEINKEIFEDFRIPVPPLEEQQRLAALLDKADHLRRTRRYAQQLSDTFLQSVFLEMFGDPATNPKGWSVESIDDVLASSQYGTSEKSNQHRQGYPVLGMANVSYSGELLLDDLAYVALSPAEFEKLRLRPGDIIFNRTNSPELIGKVAHWNLTMDAVVASYLVKLCLNKHVLPDYFSALLNSPHYKHLFRERCKKAVNQANLSPTLLREFSVMVPPLPLQQQFAQIVGRVERLRAQQREAARQAEHLFQTLLHRAFRGEV